MLDLPAALAVLKLESKELMPIESVRPEIEARLRQVRMQNEVSKLTKKVSAEFNLQYLGLPSQPDMFDMTSITLAASRNARRMPGTR